MPKLLLTLWLMVPVTFATVLPQSAAQPERTASSVVWIQTYDQEGRVRDGGSGFFVHPDVVLTRLKLVAASHTARAFSPGDKKGYNVLGIVGVDRAAGLVLLKLEGAQGVPLRFGNSEQLEAGGKVEVLGSNENLQATKSPASLDDVNYPFYEVTGAIPPASYGGPVLTTGEGEVIGVVLSDTGTPGTLLAANVERATSLVAEMTPLVPLAEFREARPRMARRNGGPTPTSAADPSATSVTTNASPTAANRAPASNDPARIVERAEPARPQVRARATSPPLMSPGKTPEQPKEEQLKETAEETPDESRLEDYTLVRVFYGTDRNRTGLTEAAQFYGAKRGSLEMGMCEISIPKTHQRGHLEAPSVWRLEFREDPKRHIMLRRVEPLEAGIFNSRFQSALGAARSRDVFVFVHGYNVTFTDAARRTAQLAYDLGFPGVPVFYSWPSQGALTGYTIDETNVEWTETHLKQFLSGLAAQSGGARIHLVAHSMGNRALTKVLRALATERPSPLFSEVLLTAPDIDADIFERDLAPAIQKVARRVTLYASSKDAALMASKAVHGYVRAGESGPTTIIVTSGIDTVDASNFDTSYLGLGHSYYAEIEDVIRDMKQLLLDAKSPQERSLREQLKGVDQKYWMLVAGASQNTAPIIGTPGGRFTNFRLVLLAALLVAGAVAAWFLWRRRRGAE